MRRKQQGHFLISLRLKWKTGTGENGMTGDAASGWKEGENGTLTGGTNGETETTGKGLIDDLTDDLSRGASDAAGALRTGKL